MSGEQQAIGDLVDTALTAASLEREAGSVAAVPGDGHTHESACLNCGTALVGAHCHQCGQHAHVHRTLGAFFHDLLHGVFHFEGRIWRTLPLLAFRPGALTRRYIDGQRARFVSPLALFLFSVFLMFAVIQQTAGKQELLAKAQGQAASGIVSGLGQAEQEQAKLKAQRAEIVRAGGDTGDIDDQIASSQRAIAIMQRTKAAGSGETLPTTGFRLLDVAIENAGANPALPAYKLQSHAYKYSWALIPISIPFLWLLFPFSRRFHLYDHTVFVTYSLSFMTLLAVFVMIAGALGAPGFAALFAIAPPLHMYRQLRGAYGVSRLGALLRTAALLLFAFVAMLIFVALIAAETVA